MSENRPHLYVNSKGYYVTRHSYSGSESYHFCAKKYELERIQGWTDKYIRSSTKFGECIDRTVQFYHQHRMDKEAAVQEFLRRWAEHKDQPNYTYSKTDLDWNRLNLTGQELIKLYTIRYPEFPYVVVNPEEAFQVETNFEVFPGTKLAGIEFTSYIDMVAQIKDSFEPIIVDMKTAAKDVPEYTVLDPQLRSYSWVKGWPNVAFLWFRKCGRKIDKGDTVTLLEPYAGLGAGDDALVLAKDELGVWLTKSQDVIDRIDKFEGKSKAVLEERQKFIQANSRPAPENVVTKQKVQFKSAFITPESAEDIGRSIKRDIISIHQAKENNFYPMQSGVRFPNEKCPMCSMRGICANLPTLRDQLLVRKQLDELDFGKDAE